jgi:CRP/FNR family transcriptional regulator
MAATHGICATCPQRATCLPAGLSPAELERFDALVQQRRTIRRGDCAFHAGDEFTSLVAVRNGSFKTSVPYEGREQVTGFPVAGALLGLDAISTGVQRCSAVALEDSQVCILPFDALERSSRKWQWLQRTLHRVLSREIVRQRGLIVWLGALQSHQRVAAFICDLSRTQTPQPAFATSAGARGGEAGARRQASKPLLLRMSRAEIGSYLGLKLETVSRAMTHLQQLGLLEVRHRRVRIVDEKALRALAGVAG